MKHKIRHRIFYTLLYGMLETMAGLFCAWQMLVLSVPYIRLLPLPILLLAPAWLFRKQTGRFRSLLGLGLGLWGLLLALRVALDLCLPLGG